MAPRSTQACTWQDSLWPPDSRTYDMGTIAKRADPAPAADQPLPADHTHPNFEQRTGCHRRRAFGCYCILLPRTRHRARAAFAHVLRHISPRPVLCAATAPGSRSPWHPPSVWHRTRRSTHSRKTTSTRYGIGWGLSMPTIARCQQSAAPEPVLATDRPPPDHPS